MTSYQTYRIYSKSLSFENSSSNYWSEQIALFQKTEQNMTIFRVNTWLWFDAMSCNLFHCQWFSKLIVWKVTNNKNPLSLVNLHFLQKFYSACCNCVLNSSVSGEMNNFIQWCFWLADWNCLMLIYILRLPTSGVWFGHCAM